MDETEPTTPNSTPTAQEHSIVQSCTENIPIGVNWWRLRQVEARAARRIAHVYGMGTRCQDSARIVAYNLERSERRKKSPGNLTHSSGARTRWKRRIMQGIDEAIKMGAIALHVSTGGKRTAISLTEKALEIERAYNARFDELLREFNPKRQ